MSSWSISETRTRVASIFGQTHLDLVEPSLHAMATRQEYARYHYQEVRRLLEDFRNSHLTTQPLLVVAHGQDQAARGDFELLMTQIGAHALACVLSIHALADVMAYAVYQALGYSLRPDALRERDISVTSVQGRLRATLSHAGIADLINKLCTDANYKLWPPSPTRVSIKHS